MQIGRPTTRVRLSHHHNNKYKYETLRSILINLGVGEWLPVRCRGRKEILRIQGACRNWQLRHKGIKISTRMNGKTLYLRYVLAPDFDALGEKLRKEAIGSPLR